MITMIYANLLRYLLIRLSCSFLPFFHPVVRPSELYLPTWKHLVLLCSNFSFTSLVVDNDQSHRLNDSSHVDHLRNPTNIYLSLYASHVPNTKNRHRPTVQAGWGILYWCEARVRSLTDRYCILSIIMKLIYGVIHAKIALTHDVRTVHGQFSSCTYIVMISIQKHYQKERGGGIECAI